MYRLPTSNETSKVRQFHLANNLSIRSTKLLRRWVGENCPATIGLNFKSFGAYSLIYSSFLQLV